VPRTEEQSQRLAAIKAELERRSALAEKPEPVAPGLSPAGKNLRLQAINEELAKRGIAVAPTPPPPANPQERLFRYNTTLKAIKDNPSVPIPVISKNPNPFVANPSNFRPAWIAPPSYETSVGKDKEKPLEWTFSDVMADLFSENAMSRLPFLIGEMWDADRKTKQFENVQISNSTVGSRIPRWTVVPGQPMGVQTFYDVTPRTKQAARDALEADILEFEKRLNPTIPAQIADAVLELPKFMTDFVITGGLYRWGKKATKRAAIKIFGRAANRGVGKTATQLAGAGFGSFNRTGVQLPKVLVDATEQFTQKVEITEDGAFAFADPERNFGAQLVWSFADLYIENISEVSGPGMKKSGKWITGSIAKKYPILDRYTQRLAKAWMGNREGRTIVEFVKASSTKVGYDGILEELGEERIGDILRSATRMQTWEEAMPTMEGMLVEAGVFSVPGVVNLAHNTIFRPPPTSDPYVTKTDKDYTKEADAAIEAEFARKTTEPDGTPLVGELTIEQEGTPLVGDLTTGEKGTTEPSEASKVETPTKPLPEGESVSETTGMPTPAESVTTRAQWKKALNEATDIEKAEAIVDDAGRYNEDFRDELQKELDGSEGVTELLKLEDLSNEEFDALVNWIESKRIDFEEVTAEQLQEGMAEVKGSPALEAIKEKLGPVLDATVEEVSSEGVSPDPGAVEGEEVPVGEPDLEVIEGVSEELNEEEIASIVWVDLERDFAELTAGDKLRETFKSWGKAPWIQGVLTTLNKKLQLDSGRAIGKSYRAMIKMLGANYTFAMSLGKTGQAIGNAMKNMQARSAINYAKTRKIIRAQFEGIEGSLEPLTKEERKVLGMLVFGYNPITIRKKTGIVVTDRLTSRADVIVEEMKRVAAEADKVGLTSRYDAENTTAPRLSRKGRVLLDDMVNELATVPLDAATWAAKAAEEGLTFSGQEEAIEALRAVALKRAEGGVTYLDDLKKLGLDSSFFEFDVQGTLGQLQVDWVMIEAAREWGWKDGKFPKLEKLIDKISHEYDSSAGKFIRDALYAHFTKEGVPPLATKVARWVKGGHYWTKLVFSVNTIVRNMLDRYPKMAPNSLSTMLKASSEYPPFLNHWDQEARAIEQAYEDAGIVIGHGSLSEYTSEKTELVEERGPLAKLFKVLSSGFTTSEKGNQVQVAIAKKMQLEADIATILDAEGPQGGLAKIFKKFNKMANIFYASPKKRAYKRLAEDLTDKELSDIFSREGEVSDETMAKVLHHTVVDSTFPITLTTKPGWYDLHPSLRHGR
jgi:hypothetical protein